MSKKAKIDRKQKAFLKTMKEKFSEDIIIRDDIGVNFMKSVMIPPADVSWSGDPHHPTLLPQGPWEL